MSRSAIGSTLERLPRMRRPRFAHLVAARLLVLAVMGQIALGVIALPLHAAFGAVVGILALILARAALEGGFAPSTTRLSVVPAVLVALQGILIALSEAIPVCGILHLLNGFVILAAAFVVAIESEDEAAPKGVDR